MLAKTLMEKAADLLLAQPPTIEKVDVLAAKLPEYSRSRTRNRVKTEMKSAHYAGTAKAIFAAIRFPISSVSFVRCSISGAGCGESGLPALKTIRMP